MSDLDWAKPLASSAPTTSRFEQGTEEWRKWRNKGLGSSDAAVLLGWSPWKTIEQLLAEKRGESTPVFSEYQQRAMDRGKRLEPAIRAWYEKEYNLPMPDETAEDKEHPFMRVSYDGINHQFKRIIEIKAPNKKDHDLGAIPDKYIPQIQWQLMICGYPRCDYVSYGVDETYNVRMTSPDFVMQRELRARGLLFWKYVHGFVLSTAVEISLSKWVHPGLEKAQ